MIAIAILSLLFLSGSGGLFFLILYLRERSAAKAKMEAFAECSEVIAEADMDLSEGNFPENKKE